MSPFPGLSFAAADVISSPFISIRFSIVGSIFIFAVTSPIGAGIGITLTGHSTARSASMDLAVGFLQALACGTFLYVTFFEILPREIEGGAHGVAVGGALGEAKGGANGEAAGGAKREAKDGAYDDAGGGANEVTGGGAKEHRVSGPRALR